MLQELRHRLIDCGLSQKEADVYLAMLELGSSSAQDISEKAGVNRSTTYLAIESLQRRGLASSVEEDKHTVFAAEDPRRLLSSVADELAEVAARQERLQSSLPNLLALFNAIEHKPKVRFFEGEEALTLVRHEIADIREPMWEVYAVDEALITSANVNAQDRIQVTKRVSGRVLMAIKPGCVPPYFDPRGIEVRAMDYDKYPFSGDMALTGKRVYIVSVRPNGSGLVIESEEIVALVRALYEAAWQSARLWNPPSNWKPIDA